jgi:hypothetical protein
MLSRISTRGPRSRRPTFRTADGSCRPLFLVFSSSQFNRYFCTKSTQAY